MLGTKGRRNRRIWPGTAAAALALTMAASLAAQRLELVSRVDPSQISDTSTEAGFSSEFPPFRVTAPQLLSNDGRYALFVSTAANLVPGQQDVNSTWDVFLRDLVTGTTTLVSRSLSSPSKTGNSGSTQAVISSDGRYVAFLSLATDLTPGQSHNQEVIPGADLLLYDRVTATTSLIGTGFDDSPGHPAFRGGQRHGPLQRGSQRVL